MRISIPIFVFSQMHDDPIKQTNVSFYNSLVRQIKHLGFIILIRIFIKFIFKLFQKKKWKKYPS